MTSGYSKCGLVFRRHREGPPAAFTIVELLAVVAVLTILVALLFPVAQSAIQQAQNATCVGNLKSMGGAHASYIADHDGRLIAGSERNPNPDGGRSLLWYHILQPYMGDSRKLDRDEVIWDPERPKWQLCPAKKKLTTDFREIGYGWNHEFFGLYGDLPATGNNSGAHTTVGQVAQPTKTVIIGDSQDLTGAPYWLHFRLYGRSGNLPYCASRHGGRGNYLMFDGHVEALTPEELTANNNYLYKKVKP